MSGGRIYVWRYALRSRAALNARSARSEHAGALVRIGDGFGCIHPWPELGDAPLEQQLALLKNGGETLLISAAKHCAQLDGAARREEASLFEAPVPESHWLVRPGDDPAFAKSDGFSLAKLKVTPDLASLREEMNRWRAAGLGIRLDANESLGVGAFLAFWKELGPEERAAIDCVEDPEVYDEDGWWALRKEGVPIAVDRDCWTRAVPGDIVVMKPARPDWGSSPGMRCFVTSYMDHAVGQLFAAATAASHAQGGESEEFLTCGLLTHRCFENDPFFEQIRCDGPRLVPPPGTGLGFDDLLEKLPWKVLT